MDDRLAGAHVLVVEDETLVLFNLEDLLGQLGCVIVGPAMRLHEAERIATEAERIDVAVLDVNIAGGVIYPVADRLRTRGVPIVFATGYGRAGLREEWREYPVLLKPYADADVARLLRESLAGAVAAS